ncbi:hypothetical protein BDW60DRAFT_138775 [Aspergillus nidulans var. acristatus]
MAMPHLSQVFKPDRRTHDSHPSSLIMICFLFLIHLPFSPRPFGGPTLHDSGKSPFLFSLCYIPPLVFALCFLGLLIAHFFPSVVYTWYL